MANQVAHPTELLRSRTIIDGATGSIGSLFETVWTDEPSPAYCGQSSECQLSYKQIDDRSSSDSAFLAPVSAGPGLGGRIIASKIARAESIKAVGLFLLGQDHRDQVLHSFLILES
jgi:hypothetical protein